jgi:hypothetical protein
MIGRGATAPAVRCSRARKTNPEVYGSRSDLVQALMKKPKTTGRGPG